MRDGAWGSVVVGYLGVQASIEIGMLLISMLSFPHAPSRIPHPTVPIEEPYKENGSAEKDGPEYGEGGIRTLDRALQPYNGLANRRLQPLGHLSGI
jgi:hypothetical protein